MTAIVVVNFHCTSVNNFSNMLSQPLSIDRLGAPSCDFSLLKVQRWADALSEVI